jgi:hypothetical protein
MRRIISILLVVAAALQVAATDRFYIEDFSINPGETKEVSILLDNGVEYSAFQADIYLPQGLSIVQEDGDYMIDLTDRKGRDHTISSKILADGGIRIMSYSTSLKVFSGNSGALVTMSIAADENFTGPANIYLSNVLFSTPAGEEIAFAEETCNVTLPVIIKPGDVNGDDNISISDVTTLIDYLLSGNESHINLNNSDVNYDGYINISDVTALIDMLLSGNN